MAVRVMGSILLGDGSEPKSVTGLRRHSGFTGVGDTVPPLIEAWNVTGPTLADPPVNVAPMPHKVVDRLRPASITSGHHHSPGRLTPGAARLRSPRWGQQTGAANASGNEKRD